MSRRCSYCGKDKAEAEYYPTQFSRRCRACILLVAKQKRLEKKAGRSRRELALLKQIEKAQAELRALRGAKRKRSRG